MRSKYFIEIRKKQFYSIMQTGKFILNLNYCNVSDIFIQQSHQRSYYDYYINSYISNSEQF